MRADEHEHRPALAANWLGHPIAPPVPGRIGVWMVKRERVPDRQDALDAWLWCMIGEAMLER